MPSFLRTRGQLLGLAAALCCGLLVGPLLADQARAARKPGGPKVERGRYIVVIGGCNDCHTPRYAEVEGKVAEAEWLVGDALGWRGPWGTTYASNLRKIIGEMSEKEWVEHARNLETLPPMPWFNLREMEEDDLEAVHAFVKQLGIAGADAPRSLPVGQEPAGPCVLFPSPPPAAPAAPPAPVADPKTKRS